MRALNPRSDLRRLSRIGAVAALSACLLASATGRAAATSSWSRPDEASPLTSDAASATQYCTSDGQDSTGRGTITYAELVYAGALLHSDLYLTINSARELVADATAKAQAKVGTTFEIPEIKTLWANAPYSLDIITPILGNTSRHLSHSGYGQDGDYYICFEDGVDTNYSDLVVRLIRPAIEHRSTYTARLGLFTVTVDYDKTGLFPVNDPRGTRRPRSRSRPSPPALSRHSTSTRSYCRTGTLTTGSRSRSSEIRSSRCPRALIATPSPWGASSISRPPDSQNRWRTTSMPLAVEATDPRTLPSTGGQIR